MPVAKIIVKITASEIRNNFKMVPQQNLPLAEIRDRAANSFNILSALFINQPFG